MATLQQQDRTGGVLLAALLHPSCTNQIFNHPHINNQPQEVVLLLKHAKTKKKKLTGNLQHLRFSRR
jgi:hypothetical protein